MRKARRSFDLTDMDMKKILRGARSPALAATVAVAVAMLSGCAAFKPDYQRPKNDLPAQWLASPAASLSASTVGGNWW